MIKKAVILDKQSHCINIVIVIPYLKHVMTYMVQCNKIDEDDRRTHLSKANDFSFLLCMHSNWPSQMFSKRELLQKNSNYDYQLLFYRKYQEVAKFNEDIAPSITFLSPMSLCCIQSKPGINHSDVLWC